MTKTPQEKIDLYKQHKNEYAAPGKPVLVEIKPAVYLAISGQGAPGGDQFTASIGALYGAAFTIKMTRKFAGRQDYGICKLEGQWWSDSGPDLSKAPKDQWRWNLLIRTPRFVTGEDLRKAVDVLLKRGKGEEVKQVRLETLAEGTCVQMLHVGPYDQECVTIARMKEFAENNQLEFHGRHHEVYLSDPRRVPPERLKTILRCPVRRNAG
ncbi:MAG TPA: GyrI-like domain-containing protein [Dongiaceae bacterium]|nr:GyrI-like domain-containing protein [Dongiaceae bacterium]